MSGSTIDDHVIATGERRAQSHTMPRTRLDKDYYAILGVARTASEDEIRKAYRRLALESHPDRHPDDPRAAERFKEVSEAYAVLINGAKRREYDEAARPGSSHAFHYRQDDLLRDLFADPRASAVFADLAREFERMGMRVDQHFFRHTLFGGRAVVVGGVFVVSPLSIAPMLGRAVRAMLGGVPRTPAREPVHASTLPLEPERGLLASVVRAGRRLLGGRTPSLPASAPADVTVPLRLTPSEATEGGERRVTLNWVGGPEAMRVTIPPGVRTGTRLRLRGKGRPRTDGSRGDAYLAVEIAED